jgi:hypothetical protein
VVRGSSTLSFNGFFIANKVKSHTDFQFSSYFQYKKNHVPHFFKKFESKNKKIECHHRRVFIFIRQFAAFTLQDAASRGLGCQSWVFAMHAW